MKIMVVDDQLEDLYFLRTVLGAEGYEVLEASDGKQALELARQIPPQLIISDILMPVMDGFALCREWRADSQLCAIPFIFYTATYTEPTDKAFTLSLGGDLFLIKPQETQVLLDEVAKLLDQKERTERGPTKHAVSLDNDNFYRQYNVHLVRKLEDKLAEIEQKNCQLAAKEQALSEANEQLEERVAERTAELDCLNQELASFNYSVSHDLRAPLRHVDGFSQALAEDGEGQLSQQAQQHLQRIRAATAHMSSMIDALLQLSRLTFGEIEQGEVDLSMLAEGIISNLQRACPDRSVEILIEPKLITNGGPALLEILLDNLLENAWKYTRGTEHARIEVGACNRNGESGYFVKDNGAGFDMRYADKLFAPFQRLHGKEFEGTGIGLATVRRIVNRHGGVVEAEGVPGKGAVFYFTLGKFLGMNPL